MRSRAEPPFEIAPQPLGPWIARMTLTALVAALGATLVFMMLLALLPLAGRPFGRAGDPFLGPGATPIFWTNLKVLVGLHVIWAYVTGRVRPGETAQILLLLALLVVLGLFRFGGQLDLISQCHSVSRVTATFRLVHAWPELTALLLFPAGLLVWTRQPSGMPAWTVWATAVVAVLLLAAAASVERSVTPTLMGPGHYFDARIPACRQIGD
jgi:hypothetical protein